MAATIRPVTEDDLPALYDLYMDMRDTCPGIDLTDSNELLILVVAFPCQANGSLFEFSLFALVKS